MKTWCSAKNRVTEYSPAACEVVAIDDITKGETVAIKAGNRIARAELAQATRNCPSCSKAMADYSVIDIRNTFQ